MDDTGKERKKEDGIKIEWTREGERKRKRVEERGVRESRPEREKKEREREREREKLY